MYFFLIIIAAKLYNSISLHRNYLLRGKLNVTWYSPGSYIDQERPGNYTPEERWEDNSANSKQDILSHKMRAYCYDGLSTVMT